MNEVPPHAIRSAYNIAVFSHVFSFFKFTSDLSLSLSICFLLKFY